MMKMLMKTMKTCIVSGNKNGNTGGYNGGRSDINIPLH